MQLPASKLSLCKAFIREREREREREPQMENEIRHFIHQHPLRMQKCVKDYWCFCLVCGKFSSPMYSCYNEFCLTNVYLHESCAQFPPHLVHPFHPHSLTLQINPRNEFENFKCHACWMSQKTHSKYRCSECDFNLDICCASLMPTKKRLDLVQVQENQIQHILRHPHPLIVCDNNPIFNCNCSFCKLPINGSRIYVCLDCNCLLDESCAEWPSQIEHPLHRQHSLTLFDQRYNTLNRCRACGKEGVFLSCGECKHSNDQYVDLSRCSACGKWLREGFSFNCSECNFSLDPCCASLMPLRKPTQNSQGRDDEDEDEEEEEEEFQIQQLSHPHPLILCEKKKGYGIPCDACQLHLEKNDYVYLCLECKFLLHKSCADLPRLVKHSFHHQHTLTLIEYSLRQSGEEKQFIKNKFQCHACYQYTSGFAYVCPNCAIVFDIRCPISKPFLLKSELHQQHPLAFFADVPYVLYCNACNRRLCTPFFRCVECEFNLHLCCVTTLPLTAKHHHRHPLSLTNSPIKDNPDENEYSEFYCDICEERRELYDPTYYCKKCHYVAHVHCLLSEIFPILEEQFLACKLGEMELDMSASVCEDNTGMGACKGLMIEEILAKEPNELEKRWAKWATASREDFTDVSSDNEIEGARIAGESSLTELDEVEWLTARLKATKRRLKELEERRAQYVASALPNSGDNENR